MNLIVGKTFGLFSIIALMALLGIGGLSSVQYAWASPGVLCILSGSSTTTDGSMAKACWGVAGDTPHTGGVVVVYQLTDEFGVDETGIFFSSSCAPTVLDTDPIPDGVTNAFLLDNDSLGGTQANFYSIPDPTAGPSYPPTAGEDSITFYFPSGPAGILTSITFDGVNGPPTLTSATSAWVQIGTGGSTPALSEGGWRFDTCALDSFPTLAGVDADPFDVQLPVAGEILSIDTTALLIAGAQLNGIWILSSLAVVAGASFALLRLQVYTKSK